MPKRKNVPSSVIRRLPRYYRFIGELEKSGFSRISSKELSLRMGLTASQIRQDLNCFGEFGQQGYGYNVPQLHEQIGGILGVAKHYPLIIIGAGNIGRAIALNIDFESLGFSLSGIFDIQPSIIGQRIKNITVRPITELEDFCNENKPKTAVLTIPQTAAPDITERLVSAGVIGFWNFSHYDISNRYPNVAVENVHFGDSAMTLCYRIKDIDENSDK